MHEIENWVEEAAEKQRIPFRKLPQEEAIWVQREITSRYITCSSPCTWWWNFKRPIDEHYDRNTTKLSNVLPLTSGSCWFIPDTEAEWLPVYDIDVRCVEKLIYDCPGFEYYVVARDFGWLVVETHHDQFYVCRDPDSLRALTR